jgi:hypothetical protein
MELISNDGVNTKVTELLKFQQCFCMRRTDESPYPRVAVLRTRANTCPRPSHPASCGLKYKPRNVLSRTCRHPHPLGSKHRRKRPKLTKTLTNQFSVEPVSQYGHLACNTMQFGEPPAFRRNISLPSSECKTKANEKPTELVACDCWLLAELAYS